MNFEEVVEIADTLVLAQTGKHLSDLQKYLLGASLSGSRQTYDQIAKVYGYSVNYLKTDAGPKLWHLLSEVCQEKVKKTNVKAVLERQKQFLYSIVPPEAETNRQSIIKNSNQHFASKSCQDWGESPEVSFFYGRTQELAQLKHWVITEGCRIVAIIGMRGIGKTYLSVKLAKEIQEKFEYVYWKSLVHAPSLTNLLNGMLEFFTHGQEKDFPVNVDEKISYLIAHLRQHRCLIILDDIETILCSGNSIGNYENGYEDYGTFFKRIGECHHYSCLIMNSREKPKEIILMQGLTLPIRSLQLKGLSPSAGYQLLQLKGCKFKVEEDSVTITEKYAGNPLTLNLVGSIIHEIFQGDTSEFMKHDTFVFDEIRALLKQQFERIPDMAKELMYWLATSQDSISLEALRAEVGASIPTKKILEILKYLAQSSLILIEKERLILSPIFKEYLLEKLREQAGRQIKGAMETEENTLYLSPALKKYLLEKLNDRTDDTEPSEYIFC